MAVALWSYPHYQGRKLMEPQRQSVPLLSSWFAHPGKCIVGGFTLSFTQVQMVLSKARISGPPEQHGEAFSSSWIQFWLLQQASHGRVPNFSSQKATEFSFFLTFIQLFTWNIRVVKCELRIYIYIFLFSRLLLMLLVMTSPKIKF